MPRIVRGGLIQARLCMPATEPAATIKKAMIDKHINLIAQAASAGPRSSACRSYSTGRTCAEQEARWYQLTERIPDGPTTRLMIEVAREHGIVLIVPVYEEELTGVYYNTAAVIDADGRYLGKYRKMHLPHCPPGFWEKFYFRPGNLGYPVFDTRVGKVGVYICYDRHFPEGARCLGLNGAELVFNPSATVAGLSEYLWKLEQPGTRWPTATSLVRSTGPALKTRGGSASFTVRATSATRGRMLAVGRRDDDDIVIADLDLDQIREVRNTWQFYRDRRPETYVRWWSFESEERHGDRSFPTGDHGKSTPDLLTYARPLRRSDGEEVLAMRREYLSPGLITYYRDPLLVVEGHMQYLWDETGKQYLDAFAGIVTGLGRPLPSHDRRKGA